MALSATEERIVSTHLREAGLADGARVAQSAGVTSVYHAATGRMWAHNNTARKQALQHMYFHSVDSVANTLTCSHKLKFWDLRRHATPREVARVQGFPEHFVVPRTCATRLLGNAVAVPCAAHALRAVVDPAEGVCRHLDLCAGVGGFAFALQSVAPGARTVGASEVLPAAVKCYAANFPDAPMLGDATEVAEWPACDLLTAGFPCQPFSYASTAARRQTHPCRDFFEVVLAAIRASGATRVVLENVPALEVDPRWRALCEALRDELGFDVAAHVLDAQDFGLPQRRRRLYLAARRDGAVRSLAPPDGDHSWTTLRDILDDPQECN